jgi:hypothetical protein
MELKSNIPELIEKLERFKEAVLAGGPPGSGGAGPSGNLGGPPASISDALTSALNAGMGKMKFRIFNKGEDAEGNSLGRYTKTYGKKRETAGRQTGYKDLEVDGSLRRSIETVRVNNNQVAIAITNDQTAKIASYQEQQIGNIRAGQNAKTGTAAPAIIFGLSQGEFDQVQAEGNEAIGQVIKKLYDEA